ncbi:MAG: potassium transporter TrkA, partial [Renibacterium salmoninarum]|nr:potassium transporter TrkA [Renibacterium salmoninarum]
VGSIQWPADSTLVAILRDEAPITPSIDDVVDGGDELFFISTIPAEDDLRELLGARRRSDPEHPDPTPS